MIDKESDDWWRQYNEYLLSPEWRERRRLVIERANDICEGCLERHATQVHHLTYDHVGDELLFELVALCEECHEKAHSGECHEEAHSLQETTPVSNPSQKTETDNVHQLDAIPPIVAPIVAPIVPPDIQTDDLGNELEIFIPFEGDWEIDRKELEREELLDWAMWELQCGNSASEFSDILARLCDEGSPGGFTYKISKDGRIALSWEEDVSDFGTFSHRLKLSYQVKEDGISIFVEKGAQRVCIPNPDE